ncbi:MAG: hypothetical protein HOD92_07160 [Deltaproteobacteria bacterium]|jgi:transposase, IS5 family|nr:hypothetical protein [Deltaproteobacteria bacterium]
MHDSKPGEFLIDSVRNDGVWDDSACQTPAINNRLQQYGVKAHINVKECCYKKLTRSEKIMNKKSSLVRCRGEHIFGYMENSMNGIFIRTIGIGRAFFQIGWMNTIDNMCRYTQLFILRG